MKNIQNLTIDINKKPFQTITANVGEVASRFVRINIVDKSIPIDLTGVTASIYAEKPDGKKVFNNVTIEDKKNGIILAELTSQILAVEGLVKLTLLLVKNGAKLCSKQFLLNVDSTIVDDEAIESTNEFTALTDALGRVNNIDSRFENVSSQLEHIKKYIDNNFNSGSVTSWEGKKWVTVGDSITYGDKTSKTYAQYIQDIKKCSLVNLGYPGTGYVKDFSGKSKIYDRLNEVPANADLITIFAGVNDYNRAPAIPLGNFGDSTFDTFYGAIDLTFKKIIDLFPTIPIGIISPIPLSSQLSNLEFYNYVEALDKVSTKYGLPFLNLYSNGGFHTYNSSFRDTFIEDGIHPNDVGHKRLACRMISWLEGMLDDVSIRIEPIPCESITLNQTSLNITTEGSVKLTATVLPSNTTDFIIWNTSDNNVISVNNGIITPLKNGSCTVTATCGNQKAICNVIVSGIKTKYTITNILTNVTNNNNISLINENEPYNATLTPNNGYEIGNVTITMNGVDITSTCYSNNNIQISNITGNIVITASAAKGSSVLEGFVLATADDFENVLGCSNTITISADGIFSCVNGSETLNAGFNMFKFNKGIKGISFEFTSDFKYTNIGLYADDLNKVYCMQPVQKNASLVWDLNTKTYDNSGGLWGDKSIKGENGDIITYIYENGVLSIYVNEVLKSTITDVEAQGICSNSNLTQCFRIALSNAFKIKNLKYKLTQ